jgi:ATP-dependent DNA ligase
MIREGDFIAQPKLDGFNALIFREKGELVVLSRVMKPLAISAAMRKALEHLPLENGTVLNGEWTCRREAWKEEGIFLFDMMYEKGEWIGHWPIEERMMKLIQIHNGLGSLSENPWPIYLVAGQTENYAQLYKSLIGNMKTEGIVLKRKGSRLVGDFHKSVDNLSMFKLKWRDGPDGMTRMIVPDEDLKTKED